MSTHRKLIAEVTYVEPQDAEVLGKFFRRAMDATDFREERLVIMLVREKIEKLEIKK